MLGQPFTLICSVKVVQDLVEQPSVEWLNFTTNEPLTGNGIAVGVLQTSGTTSALTLTFDSLTMSQIRAYVCQGCVNIDKASIQNHCASTKPCITLERKCVVNHSIQATVIDIIHISSPGPGIEEISCTGLTDDVLQVSWSEAMATSCDRESGAIDIVSYKLNIQEYRQLINRSLELMDIPGYPLDVDYPLQAANIGDLGNCDLTHLKY